MKKTLALGSAAALGALGAVLAARTLRFKPREEAAPAPDTVRVDGQKAIDDLADMIRCKTVSNLDHSLEDAAEFDKFRALLAERFPAVHEKCPPEHIGRCGLLYHWKGAGDSAPTVLMAHYDVVPADESTWTQPPFGGVIEDGVLYGRGALDTKITLCSCLEAAEQLIKSGFTPKNDIYFAFSGEEEIAGPSAADIVDTLAARGVTPALVLDEGGAVVQGVFPGVKQPCALIGTSEKGQMQLHLEMASRGGHASAPPAHTIAGELAKAVTRIESHPFPYTLTPPAAEMLDTLGRHSIWPVKLIMANLWLFSPLLGLATRLMGGELNALVRTTCAVTQMSGSPANNVMPPEASVGLNLRVICGESCESAEARIHRLIKNKNIRLRRGPCSEPSPYSETGDSEGWQRLCAAVRSTWPEAIVSPYLMLAGSDSRHYGRISSHVYRFCPIEMTNEERAGIHGNDERIPTYKIVKCAEFYLRLISSC